MTRADLGQQSGHVSRNQQNLSGFRNASNEAFHFPQFILQKIVQKLFNHLDPGQVHLTIEPRWVAVGRIVEKDGKYGIGAEQIEISLYMKTQEW
jgi:hypothetical protein